MRGLNERDCSWLVNGRKPLEDDFWLNWEFELPVEGRLVAGELNTGWPICSGAGLLECDRMTQPPRKVNTEAMVIHTRKLFLTIFILRAFLFWNSVRESG
jgi:hypothetical protein